MRSARPEQASALFDRFCVALAELGLEVDRGSFGPGMQVELVNDGPVTIVLG